MGWFWGLFTEGIVSHFIDGVGGGVLPMFTGAMA